METILDSIADGVFTVDKDWHITSFNRAAEEITGIAREDALGTPCCDVFRASICETGCVLRRTMDSGKPVVNMPVFIVNAQGEKIPISVSTALLKNREGRIIGGVETFRDLSLVAALREEIAGRFTFSDIVSKSPLIQRIFDILPDIAESGSTVLIEGESGTGKELFARAMHTLSSRKSGPFVAVNCGALPDTLLESELFGYVAGAFTDAKADKAGRLEAASGGTIFLDEIGDMSPALQVKLLRVLQERTYEPLGSVESRRVDARVIAATNRSLVDLMGQGLFRQDLYYRINVVRIEVPPLRKRKEDLPLLVDHFVGHFKKLRNKDITAMTPEAMAMLAQYDFPGNVRELENLVEYCFIRCTGGLIQAAHLPDHIRQAYPGGDASEPGARNLKDAEKVLILQVLKAHNWHRKAAAKALGMHPSTLFRKIRALGMVLPELDGRSKQ